MAVTRTQIRRRAVALVPEKGFASADGVASLVASAGAVGTLTDTTNLPSTGASTALYANQWIHRPAAANASDFYRLISSTGYAAATQIITQQGPNWTVAPLASSDSGVYILTKDDPRLWNRAINEALRSECFVVQRDEWTPVSNTRRIYAIGSAPLDSVTGITRKTQIHAIQWHPSGDASNEELWRDWDDGRREWEPFDDAGTLKIDFRHVVPGTTQKMRLVSVLPLAALTDEATTVDVDEEWAAYATILVMARWLGEDDKVWRDYGKDALDFVRDRRRAELEQYSYRTVGRESQFVGAVGVAGKGGSSRAAGSRRAFGGSM